MISPEDLESPIVEATISPGGVYDDREVIHFIRKYTSNVEGLADYYFLNLQDIFFNPNLGRRNKCIFNIGLLLYFALFDSNKSILC
jgi:hypothetical protein